MPMSPAEIKKELKNRGLTQVMIARSVKPKVSATQMNRVVWGRDPSPRLREALARVLGKTVDQIWPPAPESKRHAA
jgi:lambda repressor-like predicted transcriptional regulator